MRITRLRLHRYSVPSGQTPSSSGGAADGDGGPAGLVKS